MVMVLVRRDRYLPRGARLKTKREMIQFQIPEGMRRLKLHRRRRILQADPLALPKATPLVPSVLRTLNAVSYGSVLNKIIKSGWQR